jgi:peptidoglycan/xylan/chitin deacetylase (PgdA/CDA1 family)
LNILSKNHNQFWLRVKGRYLRTTNGLLFRHPLKIHNSVPYISFTFDDFPRSALYTGGDILKQLGLRATYYASFGLMGSKAPVGEIFLPEDIFKLLALGHELGCHTFGHCHSFKTKPRIFEDSIVKNKQAFTSLIPGATFRTFSYPIIGPRPTTKWRTGKYFDCCRFGGQSSNVGTIDLNLLKAYFLEKDRSHPSNIKDIIDKNNKARGWLIFATHDISETPSPYGCTPFFFESLVKYALNSGAKILPVAEALDAIYLDSLEVR